MYTAAPFRARPTRAPLPGVLVLALAFGYGLSLTAATSGTGPVVKVSGGQIRGRLLARGGGAVFKGIPFAQPPIGGLRWREPQLVLPWAGVRDAGKSRPPCAQNSSGWNAKEAAAGIEDCLYLDVWTPEWPAKSRKPVMLWIHGGGNTGGAGASDPLYEGTRFISRGVVLVIVDYRLGVFGFLSHPELTGESAHHSSGNYAILDQLAALRWVRDNIAALGGDPANVTIFGQSAGGADATVLMASPVSQGLFHRAILQSGVSRTLPPLEQRERAGERFADKLKALSGGALAYLRSLPTAELLAADTGGATPNVDNWLLAESPSEAFAAGRQHRLPLIAGSNAIELSGQSSPEELRRLIQSRYGDVAPKALALYGLAGPGDTGRLDPLYGTVNDQWQADTSMRCPSVLQSRWHDAAGNPTWMYEFDRAIPPKPTVVHSSELPYVFGNLFPTGSQAGQYTDVDRKLSDTMVAFWTNFARTGDPNGPGLPSWPRFDAASRKYLQFGVTGAVAVRENQRGPFCDVYAESVKPHQQFLDEFNGPSIHKDWTFFTGDGSATVDFQQREGYASMLVDATKDRANIWWALIKRNVASFLDVKRLSEPGHELRLEVRFRISEAPRRVHLQANTQKTVDFHEHLMEFDVPDTDWHTISWTTHNFRAEPGDAVNVQFAITDWGLGTYRADLDSFRADVVDPALAGPDLGEKTPNHPPVPDPGSLAETIRVAQDSMIDLQYPDVNLNGWYATDGTARTPALTVSGAQFIIMRWDLRAYAGRRVAGAGILALTTHSLQDVVTEPEEFGQIRVTEILGGDPRWDQRTVTLNSLLKGQPMDAVLNPQMIIDERVAEGRGARTLISISRPVLQRLVDGRTLGLAIRPLGPVDATFYASEHEGGTLAARLLFNVQAK